MGIDGKDKADVFDEYFEKQIIIDCVDVSGCKHYSKGSCGIETLTPCPYNKYCYYKQLQRKTQECEKLQREIKHRADAENSLDNLCTKLESENLSLKEELTALQQTYEACEKEYRELHNRYADLLNKYNELKEAQNEH